MFEEIAQNYQQLDKTPLRIKAHLGAPIIAYHGIHLDAILAYAVVANETQGRMVQNTQDYIYVPLPLDVLAHFGDIPLFASTDLFPASPFTKDVMYYHKRAINSGMSKKQIDTGTGQHKERRIPFPAIHTETLYGDVIGNAEAIAELLETISAIGKKRHAAVLSWSIEEIPSFSLLSDDNVLLKNIPATLSLRFLNKVTLDMKLEGFSPPYWHHKTKTFCIPAGAML